MKLMIALLSVAGAVVGVALVLRRKVARSPVRPMKQWARDPAGLARMNEKFREREALLRRAGAMTEQEWRAGTEAMLANPEARGTWCQVFEKVGRCAEPLLLAALDDPRCNPEGRTRPTRSSSAFEAVVQTLARIGSDALIVRLAPLLESTDEEQRTLAAMNIATVGSPESIEPTLQALQDPAPRVRSYALIGCGWNIKSAGPGRCAAYRRAVAEALAPVTAGETEFNAFEDDRAAATLAELDPEVARAVLASPRCLRLGNPHLAAVLHALNEHGFEADPGLLRTILEGAARRNGHPWPVVRGGALAALARLDPRSVEREIEAAINGPDKETQTAAVGAYRLLHDLPDPFELWQLEGGDFDSLRRPVQHVVAVVGLRAEVNNGGFSQYFFNSAGAHWAVALEGLSAMGCPVTASLLSDAAAVLDRSGPSRDRGRRIRQYARTTDRAEKRLDELSDRFYKDEDHLDARIICYMGGHAAVMREARQSAML
jgi:HEAT repeat protein